jgi:hypothetical protein
MNRPSSWSSGQSLWLLIMRSQVRFPGVPWEFSLKGRIPAVTMLWVSWYNLGLRALLALHPSISPLTSSGQRNCASWVSQTQKSVTLLSWTGGRTAKSTRTRGGIGPKQKIVSKMDITKLYRWHCIQIYWYKRENRSKAGTGYITKQKLSNFPAHTPFSLWRAVFIVFLRCPWLECLLNSVQFHVVIQWCSDASVSKWILTNSS